MLTWLKKLPGNLKDPAEDKSLKAVPGAPGWLSGLSVQLWLRSWSQGSRVQVPHEGLCWQLRAWSLLQVLCPPLSTPPLLVLCLSIINKHLKLKKERKKAVPDERRKIREKNFWISSQGEEWNKIEWENCPIKNTWIFPRMKMNFQINRVMDSHTHTI